MKKADRLGLSDSNLRDWITLFEHWQEDARMATIHQDAVKEVCGYIRQLSADEEARRLAFVRERAQRDEATLLKEAEARGEARGQVKGEAKLLKRLISKRFNEFPDWVQEKLNAADSQQLETWADQIFTSPSLADLFGD